MRALGLIGIASLTLLLTGCQTPEQIEEHRRLQEDTDNHTCLHYGLKPGTDAFANCRLQIDLSRQNTYYRGRYYYDSPVRFGAGLHRP